MENKTGYPPPVKRKHSASVSPFARLSISLSLYPFEISEVGGAVRIFLPGDNDADAEVDKRAEEPLSADLGDRTVDIRVTERRGRVLLRLVHRHGGR